MRRRIWLGWLVMTWYCVAAPNLTAATLHVDDATCPGTGSGTPASPYCRIQDAICALRPTGGVVRVAPGIYREAIWIFAGISVVSTDGPEVTTIDATGKPCVMADCTTDTGTVSCSAVTFRAVDGVGAGQADRLEGFRIRGGSGTPRGFGDGTYFVVGGGIFIRGSSPTISRNEIVDNQMAAGTANVFYGAGIYVQGASASAIAQPVITTNLIADNVADPPAGVPGDPAGAFGGGLYVGYYAAPTITQNTIVSNVAGNPSTNHQDAAGGGLAVYSISTAAVISRNLVLDNASSVRGGGVALGAVYDAYTGSFAPSLATVDSNLIAYNEATMGGGISARATRAKVRSNTLFQNLAWESGGAFYLASPQNPSHQATLVNNVLARNSAQVSGGGLFVQGANPTVRFNDLFSNTPTNVAGTRTDASYIGSSGNVCVDPLFVSEAPSAVNLQLRTGSPLLDAGDSSEAPLHDLAGVPRILDGNADGTPCTDIGAYELGDLDGDGSPDWQDPDDDGDQVADSQDCAPRTSGISTVPSGPGLTLRLSRSGSQFLLLWDAVAQASSYNVYRGTRASGQPWAYGETCAAPSVAGTQVAESTGVSVGQLVYYLVSARNVCGESPEGEDGQGAMLFPTAACPASE